MRACLVEQRQINSRQETALISIDQAKERLSDSSSSSSFLSFFSLSHNQDELERVAKSNR